MLMKFPGGTVKALTLSYDDGVIYDRRLIEIMKKNGLKGTFNVNSGRFPKQSLPGERRMGAKEALEVYGESGMEVACHGLHHQFLNEMTCTGKSMEIVQDKMNLEKLFGRIIRGAAYAYGVYDDESIRILRHAGIAYCRTGGSTGSFALPSDWMRFSGTCHHKNPKLMELTRKFLDYDKVTELRRMHPQLFYVWGHSYEFHDDNNWNIMEEFAETVGSRPDIWYATNIEVYDYVTAFHSMQQSCDGKILCNPSAQTLYLNENGTDYTLAPGQTLILP